MTKRGLLAAGILVALALPEESRAEGIAIEHNEVKCIIAGKYTRMAACFDPKPNLARGRVYFRATGTQPWYFVEFKSDAPCYNTFLPKATKNIKQVDYYVEGYATDSTSTRSADFGPVVVPREEDCKDRPVAPWVNKATVVVGAAAGGPAAPFGFVTAAGIGSMAVIGGLAAAGVVGGAAALASRGDDANPPSPPTLAPPPSVNPPPPTTPPPPPPPTQQPYQFIPRFAISPDPPIGTEPIRVSFNMCASVGSGLRFRFDFDGDGTFDQNGTDCLASRTYDTGGVSASGKNAPGPTTLVPRKSVYETRMNVRDDRGNSASQDNRVEVVEALSASGDSSEPVRRLAWSSDLDLEGGSGQVVVNGSAAVFAPKGRSTAVAAGRRGDNRVEAQIVQGAGKPGTWRFELGPTASLEPGSLRVVSGEVGLVTAEAVVFRLSGKPGERLMFTFRTER